jgi:RNA polymerase sigma factor (sigma-70 family)
MKTLMAAESRSDEQLVAWSLTGDREAFGKIVERYQALVCSITYGATGSLTLSEDLAQETFLTAWRKLDGLTDAKKLRAWLCGIARNLTLYSMRRGQREPTLAAEPLETVHEPISAEPSPSAQAVSHEEEAILWRALERIPDSYREPLILFYREHRSVERVAQELELSEDAVKQRLSRGRAMLTEQVAAFVEGTLERTTPGQAFTLGVLATLPSLTLSAKAATIGATAAKGSASANAAGLAGIFGAISALFFIGSYADYRLCREEVRTNEERQRLKSYYRRVIAFASGIFTAFAASIFWLCRNQLDPAMMISLLLSELIVVYMVTRFVFASARTREQRLYYSRILTQEYAGQFPAPTWEYRSHWSFLGLPLVHIRFGDRFDVIKRPVTAWVAIGGKYAVGALFAFGELAIAPISIGWCAVGPVAYGGLALGMLAIGACSLGVWTFGGLALGWQAYGACALGWKAAVGWIVVAHEFALGSIAHGGAGVEAARKFVGSSPFFHFAQMIMKYFAWMNLLWVVPLTIQARIVARAKKSSTAR